MDIEAERAAIRAVWRRGNRALEEQDWPSYSELWAHADHVQVLHPHEGEWLTGWNELGPSYRELLAEGPRIRSRTRDMRIRVGPSGAMAWATLTADLSWGEPGETETMTVWETVVFEKVAGAWKLVHGHVSKAPAADDE